MPRDIAKNMQHAYYHRSLKATHRSHCDGRAWPGHHSRRNAWVVINEVWYTSSPLTPVLRRNSISASARRSAAKCCSAQSRTAVVAMASISAPAHADWPLARQSPGWQLAPNAPNWHDGTSGKLVARSATGAVLRAWRFLHRSAAGSGIAVITHAHSDHARPGHRAVLASADTLALMRARLGEGRAGETQQPLAWGDVDG